MFESIDEYLGQLKKELKGSDAALIQDALSDAEEHLRTALESVLESTPGMSESDALPSLIAKYGTPSEIASAYRKIESRLSPVLALSRRVGARSSFARFFGVAAEVRVWGAFFYMLFSILTGCIYGLWAGFGTILSLFSLIFIIGLPITGLFLLSVRGIALVEGRIVEALLGVRMPRKPLFVSKNLGWKKKFKALVTESHTWKVLIYMILQLPLGFIYFTIITGLFLSSIKLFIYPLWNLVLGRSLLNLDSGAIYPPTWLFPFISLAGFLLFFLTLHLAKFAGKIHGSFAKSILVRN